MVSHTALSVPCTAQAARQVAERTTGWSGGTYGVTMSELETQLGEDANWPPNELGGPTLYV